MAHEFLMHSIDLTPSITKRFQPIYGNVDYNTFYNIYIWFKNYKIENGIHKYLVDIKIQNYKGDITLALDEDYGGELNFPKKPESKTGKDKSSNVLLDQEKDIPKVDAYILLKVIPFEKENTLKDIVLKSEHHPLESDIIIETNCEKGLPKKDLYDPNNPDKSGYIPNYRYERSGDWLIEIGKRKYKSGKPFKPDGPGSIQGTCIPDRSIII